MLQIRTRSTFEKKSAHITEYICRRSPSCEKIRFTRSPTGLCPWTLVGNFRPSISSLTNPLSQIQDPPLLLFVQCRGMYGVCGCDCSRITKRWPHVRRMICRDIAYCCCRSVGHAFNEINEVRQQTSRRRVARTG